MYFKNQLVQEEVHLKEREKHANMLIMKKRTVIH